MKTEFQIDPNVVFLNHGSFGACPRVVHDEYQRFQRQLEAQPVRFLQRELPELLLTARTELAEFLGADTEEIVFVTNPTYAVNEIARSLDLNPGDEVLCSDHEYGACRNTWQFMSQKRGFSVVEQPMPLPVSSTAQMVEQFWQGVTERTKVIFLSHISSPTALTFPVAEICRRAREQGIITLVDGAHAPGQLDVDLHAIGADYYVGTCHKWMCAPKGSAFFYARLEMQRRIEPLIIGWGWGEDRLFNSGNEFVDAHTWLGTHDPAAYITVPAAIAFQRTHDWPHVRARCHALAETAVARLAVIPGLQRVHAPEFFGQMGLVELLSCDSTDTLKQQLYDQHRIELPITSWNSRNFIRVSIQAYNSAADVEALVAVMTQLLSA